jgi:hypothetical protein
MSSIVARRCFTILSSVVMSASLASDISKDAHHQNSGHCTPTQWYPFTIALLADLKKLLGLG